MKGFTNTYLFKLKTVLFMALLYLSIDSCAKQSEIDKDAKDGRPMSGKWEAIISNGYKGDVLTFTVMPDGKTIENVEFKGHWRSSGRTEVLINLDPPGTFNVINGSFSEVKQVPDAGMWWEFIGNFKTSTTAEGSYRAAFAGGESDTNKLEWKAKRIGAK
jgi:hypothetical protein